MNEFYKLLTRRNVKTGLLTLSLTAISAMSFGQWTENFDANTDIPAGWVVIEGGSTDRNWEISSNISGDAQTPDNAASIGYHSSEAHDDFLVTKAIEVQAGVSDRLTFWIKSRSASYLEPYRVVLSTTDQTKEALTVELQAEEEASAVWTRKEFILTDYVGQTVYVAVHATGTNEFNLYADSFKVDAIPSCVSVSDLTVTNITSTTADLGWTAVGSETSWNVEYGEAGFAQGSGTMVTSSTNPYSVSGLSGNTEYEFYVQADCGNGDTSEWTGPFTFSTPCATEVPNYMNDFSSVDCWEEAFGGDETSGPEGTGYGLWGSDGFLNDGFSGAMRANLYSEGNIGWLISPTIDLSGGGEFELLFHYGMTQYSGNEASPMGSDDVIKVLMSEDNGATWTVIQNWTSADTISNQTNGFQYDIASTSPTVKFAFYASDGTVNDDEDYNFYIDNFSINDKTLATVEVDVIDLEGVQVYPNPFKDVINISDVKDVERIMIVDMAGRIVRNFEPAKQLNLSNLNAGMYLINLSYKDGSVKSLKAIKK